MVSSVASISTSAAIFGVQASPAPLTAVPAAQLMGMTESTPAVRAASRAAAVA